jgi:hypothetical protein
MVWTYWRMVISRLSGRALELNIEMQTLKIDKKYGMRIRNV